MNNNVKQKFATTGAAFSSRKWRENYREVMLEIVE